VLLIDLDLLQQSKRKKFAFPNLALMKLSAYHKAMGDEVYLNFPLQKPDIIYASCIFTWNRKYRARIPENAIIGGTGIDLKAKLPPEVENMMPDYTLYPRVDFSLGFTSRGCLRKCPWCIVPEKEGDIKPAGRIYDFWNRHHRKIKLLDNNLLAAPNWKQTMEDLIAEDLKVDFNQGLDIRLLSEENIQYLMRVKAKELRFSFDHIAYEKEFREKIRLLLDSGLRSRKLSFYFLYGFPSIDEECLERFKILASYNVDMYPMAYKDQDGREPQRKVLTGIENLPMAHGARRNINKFLRLIGRLPR